MQVTMQVRQALGWTVPGAFIGQGGDQAVPRGDQALAERFPVRL